MSESNSVFISYRREVSRELALAVWQDLNYNGINKPFLDAASMKVGGLSQQIFEAIQIRPYFMPIITIGTLDRCINSDDWVLKEIEHAIATDRIIIPLYTSQFRYDLAELQKYLPQSVAGKLADFRAIQIPYDLENLRWIMRGIREELLQPVRLSRPLPSSDLEGNLSEMTASAPSVTQSRLTAQEHFEKGLSEPKENLDTRIQEFSKAIELNPELIEAYQQRGEVLLAKGDNHLGEEDIKKARWLYAIRFSVADNILIGEEAFNSGDLDMALVRFTVSLTLDPNFVEGYISRAKLLIEQGSLELALEDLNQALDLDAKSINAYRYRAKLYMLKEEYRKAVDDYSQMIEIDSKDSSLYWLRGCVYEKLDETELAIADFTVSISLHPSEYHNYVSRGLARMDFDDMQGAIEDFSFAIQLYKGDFHVFALRGLLYETLGRNIDAANDYKVALRLNPHLEGKARLIEFIREFGQ